MQVLIEVAQAIQHLHSLKLIHCDIKPENVLLKSDGSKPIGFVTKVGGGMLGLHCVLLRRVGWGVSGSVRDGSTHLHTHAYTRPCLILVTLRHLLSTVDPTRHAPIGLPLFTDPCRRPL